MIYICLRNVSFYYLPISRYLKEEHESKEIVIAIICCTGPKAMEQAADKGATRRRILLNVTATFSNPYGLENPI